MSVTRVPTFLSLFDTGHEPAILADTFCTDRPLGADQEFLERGFEYIKVWGFALVIYLFFS